MADTDQASHPQNDKVVIKKYANRRLYNTRSSVYVTLDHLAEMVKEGVDFVVYDAKTNEDITRSVLAQIIFDEESRGPSLMPIQFLRQMIGFYGNSMQAFVPSYLELSLDGFARQQERLRSQLGGMAAPPGIGFLEEQVRQNLVMFDRAMKMFSPFALNKADEEQGATPTPPKAEPDAALDELKQRIEEMQAQIAKLASKEE